MEFIIKNNKIKGKEKEKLVAQLHPRRASPPLCLVCVSVCVPQNPGHRRIFIDVCDECRVARLSPFTNVV